MPGLGWGWGSLDGRQGLWPSLLPYFSNSLVPKGRNFLDSWDTSLHVCIHTSSTTLDLEEVFCAFGQITKTLHSDRLLTLGHNLEETGPDVPHYCLDVNPCLERPSCRNDF